MTNMKEILASIYNHYAGLEPKVLAAEKMVQVRKDMVKALDTLLLVLVEQRRLEDFQVICDDRTNPPSTVANGFINLIVYWKPVPADTTIKVFAAGDPQFVHNTTRPRPNIKTPL